MELSIQEAPLSRRAKLRVGCVALLQGLALLWLHEALAAERWPSGAPAFMLLLGVLFILAPTVIVLTLSLIHI